MLENTCGPRHISRRLDAKSRYRARRTCRPRRTYASWSRQPRCPWRLVMAKKRSAD